MSVTYDLTPWTESVVKDYLTATSQQKNDPRKFYKTHLDIDKIYAEFLGARQEAFITQEDLRDEVLAGDVDSDIRTYILKGETGSGKSQLCQWLDYELQGLGETEAVDDRIPLHIKASETSLEQIISTLAEPLGIDPEISQVTDLDPEKVADAIVTSLSANPGQKLADADVDRIIEEGGLRSVLEDNIESYQRGLKKEEETEFNPNLITKGDYRTISLTLGTDSVFHKNQSVLRQTLRDEIHRHFSHLIGVTDFQGQLREYAEQYIETEGKRPVIICEDVTTFSVLKEQLLDQIIQVESASFDIVLGYTTGFEQDDLQDALGERESQDALTYLKDRSEGYLSLTDGGIAHFLDDSLAIDLVRKYLDVIKEESGTELDHDVEVAFDKLYPFNIPTIRVVYDNLIEDKSPRRTPRVLLQKVVRRCLLSTDPPYKVIDRSPNVESIVSPIDPVEYSADLETLATWYGYRKHTNGDEDNPILINVGVLEVFGFDRDAGERILEYDGSQYAVFNAVEGITSLLGDGTSRPSLITDDKDATVSDDPEDAGKDDTGDDNGEGTVESDEDNSNDESSETTPSDSNGRKERSPGPSSEDKLNKDRARLKEFTDWVKSGGKYDSSGVLQSGAKDVLKMWYDPTRLANHNASTRGTNGIYFTHGSTVPVSIQGPDERRDLSVMLEFGEDHYHLYRDLLLVGLNDEIPAEVNIERLRSWATDSVVGLRGDIREAVEKCLPPELTIEHCIVLAKFMLTNAEFGTTDLTRELLFDRSTPKDDREYDDPLRAAFGTDDAFIDRLNKLKERRSDIEGLVDGFFLLKENLVDHNKLADVQHDVAGDIEGHLDLAQQIDTTGLQYPEWYNIGSNRGDARVRVTTFLDVISDYAVELGMLTDEDVQDYVAEPVAAAERWYDRSHTKGDLENAFETLDEALGTFGITKKQSWEDAHAHLSTQSNALRLGAFGSVLDELNSSDATTPFERIGLLHRFERSQDEHRAWEVYEALDEMITVLSDQEVDTGPDLRARILELPSADEYESKRSAVIRAVEGY